MEWTAATAGAGALGGLVAWWAGHHYARRRGAGEPLGTEPWCNGCKRPLGWRQLPLPGRWWRCPACGSRGPEDEQVREVAAATAGAAAGAAGTWAGGPPWGLLAGLAATAAIACAAGALGWREGRRSRHDA